MNILGFTITRTRSTTALEKSIRPTLTQPSRNWWWPIVREPFIGAWQSNQELRAESILIYAPVFACVTLIAADIGKLTLRLVYKDPNGIWIETENPAYSPVLRKPNRYQTITKFIEQWITSKLIAGNTYVLKQRDQRGVVTALYVLDPLRVVPLVATDGSVYYELQRDDLSGLPEGRMAVPASEIIHDTMVCLYHPLCGVSPIYACAIPALQGLAIQNNSQKFFANGSSPGGVLTAPGAISQETADRLKAYWDANYTGDNVGKVAVLGDGLKYEGMTVNAVDADLINQLKWTGETICTAFHVPSYMVGIGPPPPYAHVEPLLQVYYSQCIQSLLNNLERSLDEGLGLAPDRVSGVQYGTEFDINDLIYMDTATKTKAASEAISSGGMAPNEARKRYFALPPTAGGDTPYMQQQYYSLKALNERDLQQPAPPTKAPTLSNDGSMSPPPQTGSSSSASNGAQRTPPAETAPNPAKIARLVRMKAQRAGFVLKGSATSGNYGHTSTSREGQIGGSDPGSGSGTLEPQSTAQLKTEAEQGITKVAALVDDAVKQTRYVPSHDDEEDGDSGSWENLKSNVQDQVYESWSQGAYEDALSNLDTSDIDKTFEDDLRRNNDEIITDTEAAVLTDVSKEFSSVATLPLDPEGGEVRLYPRLDPQSIEVGTDDGEGAMISDLDALRWVDGRELTADQKAYVNKSWNEHYDETFQEAFDNRYEDSGYQEMESEAESEYVSAQWNNMSDSEKYSYGVDENIIETGSGSKQFKSEPIQTPPDRWVTGLDVTDSGGTDYDKTRAMARTLADLRFNQLAEERHLGQVDGKALAGEVWDAWKGSSTSDVGLALQLAAAEELDGNHRMTAEEHTRALEGADAVGGMAPLRAYVRAQWETTQFVLDRAGQDTVNVYRAIMIPTATIEASKQETVGSYGEYVRLPEVKLQRSGAQSTSADRDIPNAWQGAGKYIPAKSERVVLRFHVPRTSVISIPVFGQNLHNEHEAVLTGSRDRWEWDLWRNKAPDFDQVPMGTPVAAAKWHRAAAPKPGKTTPILIDLQAVDRGQPHWLTNYPADHVSRRKPSSRPKRAPKKP